MKNIRLAFIVHWLWAVVLALMVLTGLTLLGPKYGWVTNYNVAAADYLHRTMAPLFTFLTLVGIILEISRLLKKTSTKEPWAIFGKNGFGLFNFILANIFIITGILLWICAEYSHLVTAFASIVHEMASFVIIFAMLWHIYAKSHILIIGGAANVSK